MNLAAIIEIYSGGPGSGCKGPNCGRPRSMGPVGGRIAEEYHDEAEYLDTSPGSRSNPIDVGANVKRAAKLIREGKHVTLDQPEEIATLIGKIKREAAEFHEKGKPLPDFNLDDISVRGKNLFGTTDLGIPRVDMPQMAGTVDPGSPAAALLPKDAKPDAEVDLAPQFIKELTQSGIRVDEQTVPASSLRSTQEQLDGTKVAGILARMDAGTLPDQPIFVTKDNYILDGHHRWAADIVKDTRNNRFGDVPIKVHRLDTDIGTALTRALDFQKRWGISKARVSGGKPEEWLPGNMAASIWLFFGGPGSGCTGPNCGRPSEESHGSLRMPRGRQTLQRIDKELREAASNQKLVLMEYKGENDSDPDAKAKSFIVEPYSYRNDGNTFFGYDQTAKSIKAFKMMNIVRVSPLGKSYKPRWPVELAS